MSRIFPIASGSSGNCTYIGHGRQGLLVDAGISARAITNALADAAIDPQSICGIFITHNHIDHISGLRVFADKYSIPTFATKETVDGIVKSACNCPKDIHIIEGDIAIGNFSVRSFPTSHDCPGSCGYVITLPDETRCSICTDLGVVSEEVRLAITGSVAVLLESNHDITMLQKGSYPEHLKRRILSDHGHLSNVLCAKELPKLVKNGTTRIILGHLSRENNDPDIAKSCAVAALMDNGFRENDDYILYVAPPKNGKVILF
ncbi:MAG: MBL fold metallo-hydrolase [Ruminococcaceae bacterium]|nr:MBL fold metallo-hydrolase [Oscillospiraceae bacterium]